MIDRQTHRRWLTAGQLLLIGGLALTVLWNGAALALAWAHPGGWSLVLAGPGLLIWPAARLAPHLLARAGAPGTQASFRLVYDAGPDWSDAAARRALLNLARACGGRLEITWAAEGAGSGCWLAVPADQGPLLKRMAADIFPAGQLEADPAPAPGAGVVLLEAPAGLPAPAELCRQPGVEGLYYRWHNAHTATLALWGPGAAEAAGQWTGPQGRLPLSGPALRRPPFGGANPWPQLPPFPPARSNPGLAAVSRLTRLAPALRLDGEGPALRLGPDAAGAPVGFGWPELNQLRPLCVWGQAAETVAVALARQAVRAGSPLLFFDGRGTAAARLSQGLLPQAAAGRLLTCDLERPGQSAFRLNPLWLPPPDESWADHLAAIMAWLRGLGVTPAGLGQAAYRHSRVAVTLALWLAAGQGLALDPPGLRQVLAAPDFLRLGDEAAWPEGARLLDAETWEWWRAEGRTTPQFDVRLRLGHLEERLESLLALPEYERLWRPPYLDPPLVAGGTSLVWRLPAPGGRLAAFVRSQLLAVATLLGRWPAAVPPLIVLHELPLERAWLDRLAAFPAARLILAARRVAPLPAAAGPATLLVSRLERADAGRLEAELAGVRPADLRRLPERRLLLRRGPHLATVELET